MKYKLDIWAIIGIFLIDNFISPFVAFILVISESFELSKNPGLADLLKCCLIFKLFKFRSLFIRRGSLEYISIDFFPSFNMVSPTFLIIIYFKSFKVV